MPAVSNSVLLPDFEDSASQNGLAFWNKNFKLGCSFGGSLDYVSKVDHCIIHVFGSPKFGCLKLRFLQEECQVQEVCHHTALERDGWGKGDFHDYRIGVGGES